MILYDFGQKNEPTYIVSAVCRFVLRDAEYRLYNILVVNLNVREI